MTAVDPDLARRLAERGDQPVPLFEPAPLFIDRPEYHLFTHRELEVIAGVAEGHTNDALAARLGLSPLTVKSHLQRVFGKTGQRSKAALVAWCFRHRYLAGDAHRLVVDACPPPRAAGAVEPASWIGPLR